MKGDQPEFVLEYHDTPGAAIGKVRSMMQIETSHNKPCLPKYCLSKYTSQAVVGQKELEDPLGLVSGEELV